MDFEVETCYGDSHEITVFAAEFFNEKLSVHRVSLRDGSLIESRTIDDNTLSAYSVALVDLNGDGKKELLFNNHEKDDATNGIWAYTVPKDPMSGDFEKYTIATDFKNAFSLMVPNMSPGFPYAIWPEVATTGKVPAHIAVAGDGDHKAHLMQPTGDRSQFEYTDYVLSNAGGTVGALTWADLDEDGWLELYVPNYDKGHIEIFKLSAAPETFLQ